MAAVQSDRISLEEIPEMTEKGGLLTTSGLDYVKFYRNVPAMGSDKNEDITKLCTYRSSPIKIKGIRILNNWKSAYIYFKCY